MDVINRGRWQKGTGRGLQWQMINLGGYHRATAEKGCVRWSKSAAYDSSNGSRWQLFDHYNYILIKEHFSFKLLPYFIPFHFPFFQKWCHLPFYIIVCHFPSVIPLFSIHHVIIVRLLYLPDLGRTGPNCHLWSAFLHLCLISARRYKFLTYRWQCR